jgi:hypothetical protein
MKHAIVGRLNDLASTLDTLKIRVREAMANETAKAVGETVREVLLVVLCEQFANAAITYQPSGAGGWSTGHDEDQWEEDEYQHQGRREILQTPLQAVPAAAAVAVGVQVGRWWFRRQASLPQSLGLGAIATLFGLTSGVATRSILSVISAGVDILTADSDLAR